MQVKKIPFTLFLAKKAFLLSIFTMFSVFVQAQFVINEPMVQPVSLYKNAAILNTGQKTLPFSEILAAKDTLPFIRMESDNENLGFTNDNFWVKFNLKNNTNEFSEYFLETAGPTVDHVDFYIVRTDGSVEISKNGDVIPFKDKKILHRKILFKIKLNPEEQISGFLKIKNDGFALSLPLRLLPIDYFISETDMDYNFHGLFYGALLFAFLFYFFFSFLFKSKMFFLYSMYIVFIGLVNFSLDGFFHQYITPNGGWLNKYILIITALFASIFFILYIKNFLKVSKVSRITNTMLDATLIILSLTNIIPLINSNLLGYYYPIINTIGIIVLLEVVVILMVFKIKNKKVDVLFTIGILTVICGFIIFMLNNFNILPSNFYTEHSSKIGVALEILFLSLSMGKSVRLLRLQNRNNQMLALQREKDMNAMKSYFLSNLSHELRTPLNSITSMATSIYDDSKEEETQNKGKVILDACDALSSYINDIINFSEIEKGKFDTKEKVFNFSNVIHHVEKMMMPKAKEKNLKLYFPNLTEIPTPLMVFGDKEKLARILVNLIDNAIKFTESGKVWFSLKHTFIKKSNEVVFTFEIKDTGIGISKEKMSTIYESFTKDSFHDQRQFGGLGLGLYIAKTCVDKKGGKIDIYNNTKKGEQGTTAKVELTYKIKGEQSKVVDKKTGAEEDISLEPCNILLVEDNKMNQMVIKLLAKKEKNISLTITNNGKEGLDILQKSNFDIVLMDLQMPIMDGFTAISKIRDGFVGESIQNIPIIVLTADSTDKTKKRVLSLGITDYMTKPIDQQILFKSIKKIQNTNTYTNAS